MSDPFEVSGMADAAGADFDYYREIYLRGLGGERPSLPVDWGELERRAEQEMEPRAADYVFAAAGSGETMRANRAAFARRRIVPRMLRDVSDRDLSPASPAPRCRRRCCSRRSASTRSSTPTASSRPPPRPRASGCR